MTKMETVTLPSVSPAHIAVSKELGLAFAANYGGHSFTAVTLVEGGGLGQVAYHQNYSGAGCRDVSHPHQTVVLPPWVWVVDLGCDTIHHYRVQGRDVVRLGKTEVRKGMGPRHMVLHHNRKLVLLVGELQSVVEVYRIDMEDGSLEYLHSAPLSPDAEDYGAEILLAGDRVYASSRGTGLICVYNLTQEDRIVKIQDFYLGGSWPRHFAIKDQILLVADQRGDSVQLVHVDKDTGMLSGGDMV